MTLDRTKSNGKITLQSTEKISTFRRNIFIRSWTNKNSIHSNIYLVDPQRVYRIIFIYIYTIRAAVAVRSHHTNIHYAFIYGLTPMFSFNLHLILPSVFETLNMMPYRRRYICGCVSGILFGIGAKVLCILKSFLWGLGSEPFYSSVRCAYLYISAMRVCVCVCVRLILMKSSLA